MISLKGDATIQEKSVLLANYLLILYAFFLPISNKISTNIFIGVAVFTLLGGNIREKFRNAVQDKIVISFLLFYMMYVIWTVGSEHTSTAFFKLKEFKYILEISLIVYMVLQKEFVYRILGGFIAGMLFSELISYCLFFNLPVSSFFGHIPLITLNTLHPNVPFMESYTTYSICLSLSMSIILYRLLTHQMKNPYTILLFSLFFITASINIFIVASRVGYILYATSILFTLLFVFRKHFAKVVVLAVMLISIGYTLAFNYSPFFKDRVLAAVDAFHHSFASNATYANEGLRIGYYIYGWEVIKEHPVFGVGTGDHMAEVIKVVDQKEPNPLNRQTLTFNSTSGDNASFDSEYLDIAVQFGIVGLIVFFNMLLQIGRYAQKDPQLKFLQYLLVLSMGVIAGPSLIFIPAEVGKAFILLASLTLTIAPLSSTSVQRST